jgi:hypothetical protein
MKLMLIISLTAFLNSCGFDCQTYLDKNIKPKTIDGIVINKERGETGCFGIIILEGQEKKSDTLQGVCYCVPSEQGLWKYIAKGDSLHKSKESLDVEVYRENRVQKFNYPCCSR